LTFYNKNYWLAQFDALNLIFYFWKRNSLNLRNSAYIKLFIVHLENLINFILFYLYKRKIWVYIIARIFIL